MGKSRKPSSIVTKGAETLRKKTLAKKDGSFLGYEEDLMQVLGVSRPTFRQIARLLQQEQLIVIKRGAQGGFYVRRPSIDAVAHTASIYLKGQNATVQDIVQASGMLTRDTIRLATQHSNEAQRQRLKQLVKSDQEKANSSESADSHLMYENLFLNIISSMCGNPVINLFFSILNQIGGSLTFESVLSNHPERISIVRESRIRIGEAILAGDAELATICWHRRAQMVNEWSEEDLADKEMNTLTAKDTQL